ncbi:glycosyltransferase [Maridesulfovibrio sp.]|uniref:CgeB family protein n=1 Tax=Maridesulfovibrio sp. TaxID=2795000 RepID=UPI0029CA227E|nr:glycosyltransferase [Maridesulfovibrio sp.]
MLKIPSIKGRTPRILLITQNYFIIPELLRALKKSNVDFCTVNFEQNAQFLQKLFKKIAAFSPHFILSINHAGLDGDGQVLALLKQCGIPFASWFVDRPEMFMQSDVASDSLLSVFCWDPQSIPFFKAKNVQEAHYLPLGTDTEIFHPSPAELPVKHKVSFVGSSWTTKIAELLQAAKLPAPLLRTYRNLARMYAENPETGIQTLLQQMPSGAQAVYSNIPPHKQKMFQRLIQLAGTRQQRVASIAELLDFNPVIVGDAYWKKALSGFKKEFTWWSRINYEQELPIFYQQSSINFNVTSLQSLAAMNQRIFDVPACGAFLLTEYSPELEKLFEPGKEVICYRGISEIKEYLTEWAGNPQKRKRIAAAGLKRARAEHTYEHRLCKIISHMRVFF